MDTNIFSERLKTIRKQIGASQMQIASKCDINVRQYQYYESGSKVPSVLMASIIADALAVSIDYLCGRTDNPTTNH